MKIGSKHQFAAAALVCAVSPQVFCAGVPVVETVVSLNGTWRVQPAGGHMGACLPFEVDVTALVTVPSTSNKLVVTVRDDTHFSVLRQSSNRRNRKNWLFAGSDEGAKRAAVIYSLIATCRLCQIDPFAYLRDVLDRVSTHPAHRIADLTPSGWAKTSPHVWRLTW